MSIGTSSGSQSRGMDGIFQVWEGEHNIFIQTEALSFLLIRSTCVFEYALYMDSSFKCVV
jgi:hypothetical protein